MFNTLRLSAKITYSVSLILVLLLLSSAAAFIYYETHEFHENQGNKAHQVLDILKIVHTQAMIHRGNKSDYNPVVEALDQTIEQISRSSKDMSIWLVMGPKTLAFQQKAGSRGIEPPRDEIDVEAIETGLPVSRMVGNKFFRVTRPVILGTGVADDERCFACHREDMGNEDGEVIGAYSVSLNVEEKRREYVATALAAAMVAIGVSIVVSTFSVFLLNRVAGVPIGQMTRIMRRLAKGDLQIEIPQGERGDEIGEMARAVEVFRENAIRRNHAEKALRLAKEEAERASWAKSEFLASMSHDLRTPLNAIVGLAELMETQTFGPLGDHHYEEYAKDIHKSGNLLVSLINDILDLSKIEAGKYELNEEVLDVATIIQTSFNMVTPQAKLREISLSDDSRSNLPMLRCDERAMTQILNNLLSNAIKFTQENGEVTVYARLNSGGALDILVADSGIGMTEDEIAISLKPFEQADSAHSSTREGTGLGLYICQRLVQLHDGTLDIESNVGKGTVVTLRFPPERVVVYA